MDNILIDRVSQLMRDFINEEEYICERELTKIAFNEFEKHNQIGLAIQQFIGFTSAIRCNKIIDLVESMGLTKDEWIVIREQEQHLFSNDNNLEDIDEYFRLK